MSNKSISSFINEEYKNYAKYVIYLRAIPHIIDGLKPVHRKIFYTALKHCKGPFLKTAALAGYVMAEANYHHGSAPVEGAISNLTQDFVGANNVPMFSGEGSFGNRMIQEPAAARYTKVKLNSEFLKVFNDFEILDKSEDPENPEPLCYLPTIPWVLVNGAEGIAVGFSTYVLPRDPEAIKHWIRNKLEGKGSHYNFEPYFKGFKGKIYKNPESNNSWVMEGCFERLKKNVVRITEIPIGFDLEKYVNYLDKLIENKKVRDYEDKCKKDFEFIVKMEKEYDDEAIIKILRLRTTLTEDLVVIDNENRLRQFDKPEEIVEYFIEYRLKKYNERIKRNVRLTNDVLELIEEKKRFIKLVLEKKIDLSVHTKASLIKHLLNNKFSHAEALVEMKIYHFTKDEIEKLNDEEQKQKKYLEELHNMTGEKEWMRELK